jgi:hypothetical protein
MDFLPGWLARRAAAQWKLWLLRHPRKRRFNFYKHYCSCQCHCAARYSERVSVRHRVEAALGEPRRLVREFIISVSGTARKAERSTALKVLSIADEMIE